MTFSDLAEHVGLNASCLSTLFRRETVLSVTEYMQRERITTAKNMLKYSDYSVQQIPTTLGFSSQSYFTKVFRQTTGYAPAEYRRRNHHSMGFRGVEGGPSAQGHALDIKPGAANQNWPS